MGIGLITQYYCKVKQEHLKAMKDMMRVENGRRIGGGGVGGLNWLSKKAMSVEIDLFSFFSRTLPSIPFPRESP